MNNSEEKQILSGEVCIINIRVQYHEDFDMESKDFRYPWRMLENSNVDIRRELECVIKESLGDQFELKTLAIGRGSIEIIAIVATSYYAISKYKNFIESIGVMVEQCKNIISKYFLIRKNRQPKYIPKKTSPTNCRPKLLKGFLYNESREILLSSLR